MIKHTGIIPSGHELPPVTKDPENQDLFLSILPTGRGKVKAFSSLYGGQSTTKDAICMHSTTFVLIRVFFGEVLTNALVSCIIKNIKSQVSLPIFRVTNSQRKKLNYKRKTEKQKSKSNTRLVRQKRITGMKAVEMEVFCEMAVDSDLFSPGSFGYPVP